MFLRSSSARVQHLATAEDGAAAKCSARYGGEQATAMLGEHLKRLPECCWDWRWLLGLSPEESYVSQHHWESQPPPPKHLWEQNDAAYLEMVKCHAKIRVTGIETKLGSFTFRMKCKWAFRTMNSQEDTEIRLRGVPGIRMPGLIVSVEESRIWKDVTRTSTSCGKTVYWRGRSTFSICGFRIFDMFDFPFDRQALNLERLDFVWRTDKDAADHYKSMKVVSLKLDTYSMLPDWETIPACIEPQARPMEHRKTRARIAGQPNYFSRFKVHLLIQRKHDYYIRQVFFTTFLITVVSVSPLAMPLQAGMADRLGLYGGGLLTLLAFKYSIADTLPSVPYPTFADNFLQRQLVMISLCCLETLLSFRALAYFEEGAQELWDWVENVLWLLISLWWTYYYLYAAYVMPHRRRPWETVMDTEEQGAEFESDDSDVSVGLQ